MSIEIAPMTMADYDAVMALWQSSDGIGLSSADQPAAIERYLARNPGMSFIARDGSSLVGAVLCGQDGRRGYLHHLVVAPSHRRRGIGKALVEHCLAALAGIGIVKCHLFLFTANRDAEAFWKNIGWKERLELKLISRDL